MRFLKDRESAQLGRRPPFHIHKVTYLSLYIIQYVCVQACISVCTYIPLYNIFGEKEVSLGRYYVYVSSAC